MSEITNRLKSHPDRLWSILLKWVFKLHFFSIFSLKVHFYLTPVHCWYLSRSLFFYLPMAKAIYISYTRKYKVLFKTLPEFSSIELKSVNLSWGLQADQCHFIVLSVSIATLYCSLKCWPLISTGLSDGLFKSGQNWILYSTNWVIHQL